MPNTLHNATAISSTGRWYALSGGQCMSTYCCCDTMCSLWCTITTLDSKIPRSLANWTLAEHDEVGTYSFSRVCHNHCWIATTGARCLGHSFAGWHSAPLWSFSCESTRLLCRQRGGTLYWCDCLGTPYCDMCVSFGLKLLSYTTTMINYLSHQFAIQWTCPWECCIFTDVYITAESCFGWFCDQYPLEYYHNLRKKQQACGD